MDLIFGNVSENVISFIKITFAKRSGACLHKWKLKYVLKIAYYLSLSVQCNYYAIKVFLQVQAETCSKQIPSSSSA